ncbi:MAG: hypothetical protein LLF97_04290 [Planctomycetaceae bacterium]|nr:hypothetical protein [Planctomycetaceae bacterium]
MMIPLKTRSRMHHSVLAWKFRESSIVAGKLFCRLGLGMAVLLGWASMVSADPTSSGEKRLTARVYNSGFASDHDTFNGMGTASDGCVYYVLCSESTDVGGQMFRFDPATGQTRHLGDLTEACGEKGLKTIPQGKSHVVFVESDGKLYFSTHLAYYRPGSANNKNNKEQIAPPPAGYKPYPGGHFLSYDMKSGKFQRLASAPHGEGIITMTMDPQRGRLYGLTWPHGYFLRYDLAKKDLKQFGPVAGQGEVGEGVNFCPVCRAIVVDPRDGSVYMTVISGDILRYRIDSDTLEKVPGVDLRKDYFGVTDITKPGQMGYNWRQAFWHPTENVIYALHGNSGYLLRFDPQAKQVDVLDRMTSSASKRTGMHDRYRYGYLGFTLGPDQHTAYYLTGGPIPAGQQPPLRSDVAEEKRENLHLVTYDLRTNECTDHGSIFLEDGQRPVCTHSIAVTSDGTVYAVARMFRHGQWERDLISIPPCVPQSKTGSAVASGRDVECRETLRGAKRIRNASDERPAKKLVTPLTKHAR